MAGNTIILKHAGICAASSETMARILHQAGVPTDAYLNVFASHDQLAEMIADPRVRGVSLTRGAAIIADPRERAGAHTRRERPGAAVASEARATGHQSLLELVCRPVLHTT